MPNTVRIKSAHDGIRREVDFSEELNSIKNVAFTQLVKTDNAKVLQFDGYLLRRKKNQK